MTTLDRILLLIKQKYGSDAAFERALGFKPKTVYEWKRGKSNSYNDIIVDIANALGVSPNYLLGYTDTKDNDITQNPVIENSSFEISTDERKLLSVYRSLSNQGQEYIRQQMVIASQIYKKAALDTDVENIG
jgi:transcriptional regulator with XRE-family HTH domain